MTDNPLFALVRNTILAGLTARGYTGWKVARKFQPDQQGANSTTTVYVFKVGDKPHGSPEKFETWDETAQTLTRTESQVYETTFTASVELQETTDPNAFTPSDALNEVAAIMRGDDAGAALRAQAVGILRVVQVQNPYNTNDANRYDASPSFDFVLTHRREWTSVVPVAVTVENSFNRV